MLLNFTEHIKNNTIFRPDQLEEVLAIVRPNFRFDVTNTRYKYFNVPAAFDIETTSFYDKGEKVGLMYAWVFGLYGLVIIGRTWMEFENLLNRLSEILDLGERKRLIVYVHNLQFDFQFFRSHFEFEKVFATDRRKPLYALASNGVEFRCSYMLSGYNLETVGKNLLKYKVEKMTGDLDYNLIRHPETVLYPKELGYIMCDAKVVMAYIAEEIERMGGISKLPLTKTGYVRKYCRNACFYDPETGRKDKHKTLAYRDIMKRLTLDPDLYKRLQQAFCGGFTHANSIHVNRILKDVTSYDFTSSYPAVMVAERYPMGRPELIDCSSLTSEQFYKYLELYCCVFTIHIFNLQERPEVFENYISRSKCIKCENPVINNGRLVSADYCEVTITEVDFEIIQKLYTWTGFRISNLYIFQRGFLPKDFVLSILDLYKNKTMLKGVDGKEVEYMVSKGMLNATFGMSCTNPLREINDYIDDWLEPREPDAETELNRYNKKVSRFLYFAWGVYITAYARKNLFSGILEAGEDYIYSDTDSIKLINAEKHREYFDNYNRNILAKLHYALECQGIDPEYIAPETIKGEKKPLGVWDYDGHYKRFKTLGAKRYMVENDQGELSLTVSGINKKVAIPYLTKKYKSNNEIFKQFKHGMTVPAGSSGKNTHIYIDTLKTGTVTDYLGKRYKYKEKTGIHLEAAEYRLSIHGDFMGYIVNRFKGL